MKSRETEILGSVYECPIKQFLGGRGAVYSQNGVAPTILTMNGGGNHPFVIIRNDNSSIKISEK